MDKANFVHPEWKFYEFSTHRKSTDYSTSHVHDFLTNHIHIQQKMSTQKLTCGVDFQIHSMSNSVMALLRISPLKSKQESHGIFR